MPLRWWLAAFVTALPSWGAAVATSQISVDQAGYLPDLPKRAMVANVVDRAGKTFVVRRSVDDSAVFWGALTAPVLDADSGDVVQSADFSAVHETGRYYVEIPGVGKSWTFTIAPDVYDRVYFLAMRAFYGQRCGTEVDLGQGFKHGPCHTQGSYDASTGKSGAAVSTKGWHDAGDYGRYVVNSGITTGTLLWTWEFYGDRVGKISLHIPESGGAFPEFLSEVKWNLEWMLSLQDTDGGVFHKQTAAHFCGFVLPENDALTSLVIGTGNKPFKSSCATADLAAVAAAAARLYRPYNAAFAARCLLAAEKAWTWLEANPNVTFRNPAGITTGEYSDGDCGDERLWAAAELWHTTHADAYQSYFLAHYREFLATLRPTGPVTWSAVAPFALWGYLLWQGTNAEAVAAIHAAMKSAADEIVARTKQSAYATSLAKTDYIWGSNGVAANYGLQLLVAQRIAPSAEYTAAAADNLHYLLGRNTFSLSWVTGVGDHSYAHPHHRPSVAMGRAWPGLLSGGPNSGRQDDKMKAAIPMETKPARCYIDDSAAYACNEVAINWNAPLVFLLAGVAAAH